MYYLVVYIIYIYHGPPKPTFLEVFMVNNMVFRWPKPLFFMVLGDPGGNSREFGLNLGIADDQQTKLSMRGALKLLIFQLIFKNQNGHPGW